jgi:flagellar basal-body rod protein FlgC
MTVTGIASSGLKAAATRLEASASNVANAQSAGSMPVETIEPIRPVYRPLRTLLSAQTQGGLTAALSRQARSYAAYAPDLPFADGSGMVAHPEVDPAEEAVEQASAMAAFRANLSVIRAADEMMQKLLDVRA